MGAILANFVFFDERSRDKTSNFLANPNNASSIIISVVGLADAGGSLTVEGLNDLNRPHDYLPLSVVSLSNYKPFQTITADGFYAIPFEGILRCRIKSSIQPGAFKVFGLSVKD